MIKRAGVYLRDGEFYVHSYAVTGDGMQFGIAPYFKVSVASSDADLGSALQQALDASREGAERQESLVAGERLADPLIALAEVKSWRAFMRGCSYAGVWQKDGQTFLEPLRNNGRGTFLGSDGEPLTIDGTSPVAIAAKARELLLAELRP